MEDGHLRDGRGGAKQVVWDFAAMDRSALAVGSGAVGSRIAVLLRVVGMSVDGAGRRARTATGSMGRIVGSSSALLVVVAAALAVGTRGLIGADVLPAMRSSAELINWPRGNRSKPQSHGF